MAAKHWHELTDDEKVARKKEADEAYERSFSREQMEKEFNHRGLARLDLCEAVQKCVAAKTDHEKYDAGDDLRGLIVGIIDEWMNR